MDIIFIIGATATGKSSYAEELRRKSLEKFKLRELEEYPKSGESLLLSNKIMLKSNETDNFFEKKEIDVVNADALQLYRDLPILSSSPAVLETYHKFYNFLEPHENFSAGQYAENISKKIFSDLHDIESTGNAKDIIIVGGSGFYISSLCHGISNTPQLSLNTHKILDNMKYDEILAKLEEVDLVSYERIDRRNTIRIRRAYGVYVETGKAFSEFSYESNRDNSLRKQLEGRNVNIKIYMIDYKTRQDLYDIIGIRLRDMLEFGAIDEVNNLYKLIGKDFVQLPIAKTLGVAEILSYIDGKINYDTMFDTIYTHTRRYAKRQLTWFRNKILPYEANVEILWR